MSPDAYDRLRASGTLPSPTGVVLEVLRIANSEDSSIEEIANVAAKDPALAARILKVVNSPWLGSGRKTETILDAVRFLGTRTVISLALGFSLVGRYRRGLCRAFDYEAFWAESFIGAVAARHCSARFGNRLPDQAYACRLLSKIGRLAFATTCPNEYAEILSGVADDGAAVLLAAERNTFGVDHDELTARMMADWYLPDAFCAAAREQDSASAAKPLQESHVGQLAWALQVSTVIARALVTRSSLEALAAEVCVRGIDVREYPQLIRSVGLEWEGTASLSSLSTQATPNHEELYAAANRYLVTAYESAQNDAMTDELTQLGNRRVAHARLAEYWVASSRYGHPLACLMLDLDGFKSINDEYGHAVGDEVLERTAEMLRQQCRADEPAFRIGGDEFLILCPHSTATEAVAVANRLRTVASETAIATTAGPWRMTISIGVAERAVAMKSPDDLLAAADGALYTAKRSGRNQVRMTGQTDGAQTRLAARAKSKQQSATIG